jgi:hypothetical protein
MKVFNAASKAILLRPFAAGEIVAPDKFVLIEPGSEVVTLGPILSKYRLRLPYQMEGNVLVCDWDKPWVCWIEELVRAVVTVNPDKAESYKQPFSLSSGEVEGFWFAFSDNYQLINF